MDEPRPQEAVSRAARHRHESPDLETTAHDFRNLLQCAGSAIRVATARLWAQEDDAAFLLLQDAGAAISRASHLSHSLAARRPDAPRPRDVQIPRLVHGLRGVLRLAVGESNRLDLLVSDRLPAVRCDPVLLENVLVNLVTNAREASSGETVVLLEARECHVVHGGGADCRCVALSVTDCGCGMTDEVASQATERRFTTKASSGGGHGLAEVRRFVEALNGLLQLRTAPGNGTSIILHLPARDAARLR